MSIKATFPAGAKTVSVSGLYQWDYGQILEIESADMGTEIVEVHFACPSMSEAVVRSCSFSNGVGTVTIPDTCLEQTNTITAWVYRISGTQGHTLKTITMPITARTRPAANRDIPQEVSDRYTELITEVNETIDGLENGDILVARASNAARADHAATAGNAETAGYAVSAGNVENAKSATTADSATKATQDGDGNIITSTYAKKNDLTDGAITVNKAKYLSYIYNNRTDVGTTGVTIRSDKGVTYIITMFDGTIGHSVILNVPLGDYSKRIRSSITYDGLFCDVEVDNTEFHKFVFYKNGEPTSLDWVIIREI